MWRTLHLLLITMYIMIGGYKLPGSAINRHNIFPRVAIALLVMHLITFRLFLEIMSIVEASPQVYDLSVPQSHLLLLAL